MKKTLPILLITFWCAIVPLAVAAGSQEPLNNAFGIVSAPLANVHEDPLPKSRLLTQVLMGDEVSILEKSDNRYRVLIPGQGNREGWIQQEAVRLMKDKGRGYLNADRQWIVISAPKSDVLILDKTGDHKVALYAGTRLPLVEKTAPGHDYKVQFPDRSEALVDAAEAMPAKSADPVLNDTRPEELAKTARRFQGVRFLAGGLSAQGIDAVGLIHIIYRIHGIPISTEIEAVKTRAARVSKKDLDAGDILIFNGGGLGLYLGNGQFLQTSKKAAVRIAGIQTSSLQYGLRVIGAAPEENKIVAEMTADEILLSQARAANYPLGKRIVYWAGRFIGTPYDTDPLGRYVRRNQIVADDKVDCMYHTFRSVELAQSNTPGEAVEKALDLRFISRGTQTDGLVANYELRYQYGEDMVFSAKWGKNITADLGATREIAGSRGRETVSILPKNTLLTGALQKKLQDGDILYWVKDPKKRAVEEVVAHLSIVHIKSGKPYLIHASGDKDRQGKPGSGAVKEVLMADYLKNMKFIGAFVTRFEQ